MVCSLQARSCITGENENIKIFIDSFDTKILKRNLSIAGNIQLHILGSQNVSGSHKYMSNLKNVVSIRQVTF